MGGFAKTLGPLVALVAATACQETPKPPTPLPPISSPIPERAAGATRPAVDTDQLPPEPARIPTPAQLLDGPLPRRFATPGAVRWTVELGAPITALRWSSQSGLAVSTGAEVHNVTSWGQDRWRVVAGKGHRLFVAGDKEVVWSPQFKRISEIRRWGRQGWHRKWSGDLVGDEESGIYLVDAATVAAIGSDGKDRWRASLEGLRRLEGPYPCSEGILFHGIRGLEGVAVTISKRGAVMRETVLERGALVLGAGPFCEPLVWHGGEVALLDSRGLKQWRYPAPSAPIVHRIEGGFLLATYAADAPVRLTAIHDRGTVAWSNDLPVTGRLTRVGAIAGDNLRSRAVGLCLDVSSPCARPKENRGPFNTLLTPAARGALRVLVRHTRGHLNMIPYAEGGFVVASSPDEELTELTRRDADESVIWQVSLPGRLSAGPYTGPSGEIYVATCRGWGCGPPHLLIAVTGTVQEEAP
jgi:hypothetical protein